MQPDLVPSASSDLDLFGPHFQDDPPAVYEQLRRSGAVHFLPRHGWYLVMLQLPVRVRRRPAD